MGRQGRRATNASKLAGSPAPADGERVWRGAEHVGVRALCVYPAPSLPEQWGEWLCLLEHGVAPRRAQYLGLVPEYDDHRRPAKRDGDLQPRILRDETPGAFRAAGLRAPRS